MRSIACFSMMLLCSIAPAQINPNQPTPKPKPSTGTAKPAGPKQFTGNSSILVVFDADCTLKVDYEVVGNFRAGDTWKSAIMAGTHVVECVMGDERWRSTVECKSGQQLIVEAQLSMVRAQRVEQQSKAEAERRAQDNDRRMLGTDERVDPLPVLFVEDFNDNSNGWLIQGNDKYEFNLFDGKYVVTSKGGAWFATIPIPVNSQKDWEVSVKVRKISGTDNWYYGIKLGLNVSTSFYHFAGLTGSGNAVFQKVDPSFINRIGGEIYPAVQRGNVVNTISVRKIHDTLNLFINGTFIGETSAEELFGNYFGFAIWSGQEYLSVEFDDFTVRGFP